MPRNRVRGGSRHSTLLPPFASTNPPPGATVDRILPPTVVAASVSRPILSVEQRKVAVLVLRRRRTRLHNTSSAARESDSVDRELWKELGAYGLLLGKDVTWDALINGIERYDRPLSRSWERSLAAVYWAGEQKADWVAAAAELQQGLLASALAPGRAPAVSRITRLAPAATSEPVLLAKCRDTTVDHRAIIVGQLPSPNLHAIVFVRPADRSGVWFSQEAPLRLEDGAGAFAAYAYFGNPSGIAHRKRGQLNDPLRYDVQIFALRKRWSYGRRALSERQRNRCLAVCEVVCKWPADRECHQVRRERQAVRDLILSHAGAANIPVNLPVHFDCVAPVTLTWAERASVNVELRLGRNDESVLSDSDPINCSGLILELPRGKRIQKDGHRRIEVPMPGLYRVKLRHERRVFLDPFFEIWLQIAAPKKGKRPPSRATLPKQRAKGGSLRRG
jgi:hypothetical protein